MHSENRLCIPYSSSRVHGYRCEQDEYEDEAIPRLPANPYVYLADTVAGLSASHGPALAAAQAALPDTARAAVRVSVWGGGGGGGEEEAWPRLSPHSPVPPFAPATRPFFRLAYVWWEQEALERGAKLKAEGASGAL